MGFLDKIFGGVGKKPKEISPVESLLSQEKSLNQPKSEESVSDYRVEVEGNRTILFIPADKVRNIGGQEGVTRLYRELCKGRYPLWANDYGAWYGVEMPSKFFCPDTEAKVEEFKRTIDERSKKK